MDELAVRKLEYLDIATEKVPDYKYKESEDPCKFKSSKTGRGPLTSNWKVRLLFFSLLHRKSICLGIYETDNVCI